MRLFLSQIDGQQSKEDDAYREPKLIEMSNHIGIEQVGEVFPLQCPCRAVQG